MIINSSYEIIPKIDRLSENSDPETFFKTVYEDCFWYKLSNVNLVKY